MLPLEHSEFALDCNHVAVITLSDAPTAGYNLTFFSR